MIKYLLSFMLILSPGFTKMIGAISMTVNGDPITLYEIETIRQNNHISKEDAVNALIQQRIEEQEIKQSNIYVTPDDINKRIEMIAQKNNLTMPQFQQALQKEGKTLASLKKDLEVQLKKDKLYQKILSKKLRKPTNEALLDFYKAHQKEFTMPGKISILEYLSNDPKALQAVQMQPMLMLANVKVTPRTLDLAKINPQLAQLLLSTPTKKFTQIINMEKNAAMFFIQSKEKPTVAPFEQVKQNIFMKLMNDQKEANLIAYFEKKKSEADIKVIRKP